MDRRALFGLALLLALVPGGSALAQGAPPACRFVLGFAAIQQLIPGRVGVCADNEQHNPANGDALQHTTTGLLVWRKADNWTAFTDGYRTWINGPDGLAERLNTQRYAWEANPDGLPPVPDDTLPAGAPPSTVRIPGWSREALDLPGPLHVVVQDGLRGEFVASPDTAPVSAGPGEMFATFLVSVANGGSAPIFLLMDDLVVRDGSGGVLTAHSYTADQFPSYATGVAAAGYGRRPYGGTLAAGSSGLYVAVFVVPSDAVGLHLAPTS